MTVKTSSVSALEYLREQSERYKRDCSLLAGGDDDDSRGANISALYFELVLGVNSQALLDKDQQSFVHKTIRIIASSYIKDVQKDLRTKCISWDPQARQEVVQLLLYIHSCYPYHE